MLVNITVTRFNHHFSHYILFQSNCPLFSSLNRIFTVYFGCKDFFQSSTAGILFVRQKQTLLQRDPPIEKGFLMWFAFLNRIFTCKRTLPTMKTTQHPENREIPGFRLSIANVIWMGWDWASEIFTGLWNWGLKIFTCCKYIHFPESIVGKIWCFMGIDLFIMNCCGSKEKC